MIDRDLTSPMDRECDFDDGKGQSVEDLVTWAHEILERYES
jgi:hypothetical protein